MLLELDPSSRLSHTLDDPGPAAMTIDTLCHKQSTLQGINRHAVSLTTRSKRMVGRGIQ
jgi:hypothetical protein